MKKCIYIALLCLTSWTVFAQEAEQIDLGPYGTLVVRTNKKSIEYFETQIKLWEKKVKQNKKDANAWLNYFAATKCAYQMETTRFIEAQEFRPRNYASKFKFDEIAQEANKYIPDTFEAYYMLHFQDNKEIKKNYSYLLKANELKPYDQRILFSLLRYYDLVNDQENVKLVAHEIAKTSFISPNAYNLAYNILTELDEKSLLVTSLSNYYACLILQKSKGIKPNVIITTKNGIFPYNQYEQTYINKFYNRIGTNYNGLKIDSSGTESEKDNNFYRVRNSYFDTLLATNIPIYFSNLFLSDFKYFEDKIYLHGLTYRYRSQPTNYIYKIKENYEKNYSLDYIKHDISPNPTDNYDQSLYYMYYPSALKMYEFYKEKGMYLQQQEMKKFIKQIAEKSGKDFNKILETIDKPIDYPFIAENIDLKKTEKSFVALNAFEHMGKYEVTNKDYRLFLNNLKKQKNYDLYAKCMVDSTKWNELMKTYNDPMVNMYGWHPAYANYPVVNISYEGATEYCKWLTEQYNDQLEKNNSSHPYVIFRLPTEQEWRYAAGSKNEKAITPFPNDNIETKDLDQKGLMKSEFNGKTTIFPYLSNINPEKGYQEDGGFQMLPVYTYPSNTLGLHNMFGNVAEMTSTKGIIKGGSWADFFEECTFDKNAKYSAPDPRVGFRMIMEIRPDIADLPTLKLASNLGVDKSEITHFYWEEFLNYQKEYYGANSREYRDNLPDSTLVKKGECEHYNSESYKHPAYRNMPMIGISQKQAQNYTEWRTNRVFENYLESNAYITRIDNAPKSDFTVEKYYQNGLTDYTINTVEKFPYVPNFAIPSIEDYQQIKVLAIGNNNEKTKTKSLKMTFEIDSIALCNLNEINTFIDPKLKNIVYYLESGIAEWTSESDKVINGSIEQNELHKKGAVTDANQLKYIGFRNKVEWKKWEGRQVPGPENIPEIKHNSVIKIEKNLYCLKYEDNISDYWSYLKNLIQLYGINSNEYKIAFPDSTLWKSENIQALKNILNYAQLDDSLKIIRTIEKTFVQLDTLTKVQLDNFLKYRSDQEFKNYLIENEYIKNLHMQNNPPVFTKEAYYTGKLDSICLKEKFMYYPVVSVPTEHQKQVANSYTNKQLEKGEYAPTNPNSIYSSYVNKTYYDLIQHKSKSFPGYYRIYELKKGVKTSDIKPFDLWENYRFVLTWKQWNPTKTN